MISFKQDLFFFYFLYLEWHCLSFGGRFLTIHLSGDTDFSSHCESSFGEVPNSTWSRITGNHLFYNYTRAYLELQQSMVVNILVIEFIRCEPFIETGLETQKRERKPKQENWKVCIEVSKVYRYTTDTLRLQKTSH